MRDKKSDAEIAVEWFLACARVNPRSINAKVLRGEVDSHELFKDRPIEEPVSKVECRKLLDDDWHDIPGFGGNYKINSKKEVLSVYRGKPKVMSQRKMRGCGEARFVSLMVGPHNQVVRKVDELYERTFGEQFVDEEEL